LLNEGKRDFFIPEIYFDIFAKKGFGRDVIGGRQFEDAIVRGVTV
jgi:hypothetical protein